MFRISVICQDTRHPEKRRRHAGRAHCQVAGCRFETRGPAPIYKLATLLWLNGYAGEKFEVWDDHSPFSNFGGLAMRGKVRSWVRLVKGKPNFTRKAQPDPDLTPDERQVIAHAAGTVVDLDETRPASGFSGAVCATHPSDGPDHRPERERASTRVVTAHTPEAA